MTSRIEMANISSSSTTLSYTLGVSTSVTTDIFTSTTSDPLADPFCGMEIHYQCETVRTIKKVIFSLTIVMDVIALFILCLYRKYQSFSQRIFLHILLSNLVEGIAHLMDDGVFGHRCVIAAFLVQTAGFALFMWVCALTLFLFILLRKNVNSQKYERWYMTVCWGVPVIMGIVPFVTDHYGPAGAFCWITAGQEKEGQPIDMGEILRLALWWVPVPLGILIILIAFIWMICKASRLARTSSSGGTTDAQRRQQRMVTKYLYPLAGYGVSFVILHGIMFVDRMITLSGHPPLYVMRILQIVSISIYGTILCTLFYVTNGKNELSRSKLKAAIEQYQSGAICHKLGLYQETTMMTRTVQLTEVPTVYPYTPPTTSSATPNTDSGGRPISSQPDGSSLTLTAQITVTSSTTDADSNNNQGRQRGDTSETKEPERKKKSILKDPRKGRRKSTNNSLSLTFLNNSTSEAPNSHIRQEPNAAPRQVISPLCNNITSQTAAVQPPSDASCPRGVELVPVGELDETIVDSSYSTRVCHSLDEQQLHSLKLETHLSYLLERTSEMPKIYLLEDRRARWESWKDDQSLESFTQGLEKSLKRSLTVMVHDMDGAYFGEAITWSQIKSTGDRIRVIINEGVTAIEFTPSMESHTKRSRSRYHKYFPDDSLEYATTYDTPSCV